MTLTLSGSTATPSLDMMNPEKWTDGDKNTLDKQLLPAESL